MSAVNGFISANMCHACAMTLSALEISSSAVTLLNRLRKSMQYSVVEPKSWKSAHLCVCFSASVILLSLSSEIWTVHLYKLLHKSVLLRLCVCVCLCKSPVAICFCISVSRCNFIHEPKSAHLCFFCKSIVGTYFVTWFVCVGSAFWKLLCSVNAFIDSWFLKNMFWKMLVFHTHISWQHRFVENAFCKLCLFARTFIVETRFSKTCFGKFWCSRTHFVTTPVCWQCVVQVLGFLNTFWNETGLFTCFGSRLFVLVLQSAVKSHVHTRRWSCIGHFSYWHQPAHKSEEGFFGWGRRHRASSSAHSHL